MAVLPDREAGGGVEQSGSSVEQRQRVGKRRQYGIVRVPLARRTGVISLSLLQSISSVSI